MTHKQTILELDLQRRAAMLRADVNTLAELFSDDLAWIHANGKIDSKESLLNNIRNGVSVYKSIEVTEDSIRNFGESSFLVGRVAMTIQSHGELKNLNSRFTIVYSPSPDGKYKVVHWQTTGIR